MQARKLIRATILAGWILPASADTLAAQEVSKPPAVLSAAPEPVASAEALRYGAALEEQASAELMKWANGYVQKKLRQRPVDAKRTMADVDARFARTSEEARDAATFLTFYLAYKDEQENQKMLGIRIKEIDRETTEIMRQIDNILRTQDLRSMSPSHPLTMQERLQQEEDIRKREEKLREYADGRQLKATQLAKANKKVGTYLTLLGVVYPRMQGISPSLLRDVK